VTKPSRPIAAVLSVCIVTSLAFGQGCSPRREARFADPLLNEVSTKEIVLMPIVDQRENRLDPFDVGRHISRATGKVLTKKGYTVLTSRLLEGGHRPPFEGFAELSAEELSALGPEGSKLLLFVAVDKVTYEYDRFGDAYSVWVSGILVDRSLSKVIWRDSSSGDTNFGGFMSVMSPAGSQYDAVYEALNHLFKTVPDFEDAGSVRRPRERF
jgi:hypothetical protein